MEKDAFIAAGLAKIQTDLAALPFRASPSWEDLEAALASLLSFLADPDASIEPDVLTPTEDAPVNEVSEEVLEAVPGNVVQLTPSPDPVMPPVAAPDGSPIPTPPAA